MNRGTNRASKFLVALIAVTAFATSASFAGQFSSQAPRDEGNFLMPIEGISDAGSVTKPSINPSVVDPDGTWTFNTNGGPSAWSLSTNWAGGVIADGGGFANFSTHDITGARNPDI